MRRILLLPVCTMLLILTAADAPSALEGNVGKPLKISGTTLDGKDFSSDQWKGKVVLVDFWATWCGPCVKEMPNVKKIYDQYHDKGLEIVGVSSDFKPELLKKFLAEHAEYSWPQLFDPKSAKEQEMHPLTESLKIDALPVMILIDKQGICRSVKAADEMETLVPKLLAE